MTNNYSTGYLIIEDSENFVRIDIIGLNYPDAELDWDKNWINCLISVKAGAFSGKFNADLMTFDFKKFQEELKSLYKKLDGTANFTTLENQLNIKITGDGIGHFNAKCNLMDNSSFGNELCCEIDFDQTQIPELLNQLEKITAEFPVFVSP
ncbi:MAG: hypothetical protein CL525_00215 [Aequorivita sp.]|nr:hypothetical protein [Aequorivita sp.]MBF29551.1 hypothetical protein [Aequorivita sp.]|tara:strand:+ start:270684 stop:271136 length:453 start_codon:yes stop_codon:yes gene_type:complete